MQRVVGLAGSNSVVGTWRRAAPVSAIILFVWVCLVAILAFIDVFIVPLRIEDATPVTEGLLAFAKVGVSGGLIVAWLYFWHWLVNKYYQRELSRLSSSG